MHLMLVEQEHVRQRAARKEALSNQEGSGSSDQREGAFVGSSRTYYPDSGKYYTEEEQYFQQKLQEQIDKKHALMARHDPRGVQKEGHNDGSARRTQ